MQVYYITEFDESARLFRGGLDSTCGQLATEVGFTHKSLMIAGMNLAADTRLQDTVCFEGSAPSAPIAVSGRWPKPAITSALQQDEPLRNFVFATYARLKPASFPTHKASSPSEEGMDSTAHLLTGEHSCVALSNCIDDNTQHLTLSSNFAEHTNLQASVSRTLHFQKKTEILLASAVTVHVRLFQPGQPDSVLHKQTTPFVYCLKRGSSSLRLIGDKCATVTFDKTDDARLLEIIEVAIQAETELPASYLEEDFSYGPEPIVGIDTDGLQRRTTRLRLQMCHLARLYENIQEYSFEKWRAVHEVWGPFIEKAVSVRMAAQKQDGASRQQTCQQMAAAMQGLWREYTKLFETKPGDTEQVLKEWILAQQRELQSSTGRLFLSLPSFVSSSDSLMQWIWDYFRDIHRVEKWVLVEVEQQSSLGQALVEKQVNKIFRQVVLSTFQKGLHAEVQQLLHLQGCSLIRKPYIAISFPACCHCKLLLETCPVNFQGQSACCRFWGSSNRLFVWPAADPQITEATKLAFLGEELFAQFSKFHDQFTWSLSGNSRQFLVGDKARLAWWLVTENLARIEQWLGVNGADVMTSRSLSRYDHASGS